MFRKARKKVSGWLTSDDLKTLEEAGERKLKYKKVATQKWICGSCDYSWFYSSSRCPVCESSEMKKL